MTFLLWQICLFWLINRNFPWSTTRPSCPRWCCFSSLLLHRQVTVNFYKQQINTVNLPNICRAMVTGHNTEKIITFTRRMWSTARQLVMFTSSQQCSSWAHSSIHTFDEVARCFCPTLIITPACHRMPRMVCRRVIYRASSNILLFDAVHLKLAMPYTSESECNIYVLPCRHICALWPRFRWTLWRSCHCRWPSFGPKFVTRRRSFMWMWAADY